MKEGIGGGWRWLVVRREAAGGWQAWSVRACRVRPRPWPVNNAGHAHTARGPQPPPRRARPPHYSPLAALCTPNSRTTQYVPQVHTLNMEPSAMGALDLSDSDGDAPFDTPAARKNKNKAHDSDAEGGDGAAGGKARTKESHYTAEEAREAALRRELENIRNVNKVIEGVVQSLQKAKDNMAVRSLNWYQIPYG